MATSFLQSSEWGVFQAKVGLEPRVLQLDSESVQVLICPTPLGNFWYVPHATLSEAGLKRLVAEARTAGVLFIRYEAYSPETVWPAHSIVVKSRQPQQTLVLDLKQTSEDLLAAMHPKTRYNIRLAEKKFLTTSWEKNAAQFCTLMHETSERDGFGAHPDFYYEQMLVNPLVEQLTVLWQGQPIASAIFIACGARYTYLHGASSNARRDLMAPYLVQWTAITRAQMRGFKEYDFWGIAPDGVVNHPLAGVTRFKLGFGGTKQMFGDTREIPIKPWLYRCFTILKKIKT